MNPSLPDFRNARVLVAGDLMLDRYWYGETSRISPEAPVPVVRVGTAEERAGGAGNVALNVAALGGRPVVVGLTGEDEAAAALERLLHGAGVECDFRRLPGAATITKLRVISRHQQLIRLDFEDGFAGGGQDQVAAGFRRALDGAGAVVLSDYGKGTLGRVPELIAAAREAGVPVLVDPKGTDFTRYRGATLITPNLHEFEAVAGPCAGDDDLASRGTALMDDLALEALLVTRSERGMTLLRRGAGPLHLPARAREVYDVTGAGDTVIAVLAAALAAGAPLEEATALSNLAAGIVVSKLGTATASVAELRRALREDGGVRRGIVSEDELVALVEAAREHGEQVVMTNGCFDILHPGHVAYLQQARALGDHLVVAVNDDASVRRLKGADRPVNPLERRMAVLAALECVDWVVPFSEDTPERLICRVRPHLLVKGGDNDPERIPGGRCVREAGGEVRVLTYIEGVSTTGIIGAIRGRPQE